jgi:hypothetical protein
VLKNVCTRSNAVGVNFSGRTLPILIWAACAEDAINAKPLATQATAIANRRARLLPLRRTTLPCCCRIFVPS